LARNARHSPFLATELTNACKTTGLAVERCTATGQ